MADDAHRRGAGQRPDHTGPTRRDPAGRYRQIVEGTIQGVLAHRDFHILFANQACARIFGYAVPTELYALDSFLELVVPRERPRLQGFLDARMSGREAPERYEFEALRPDGTSVWLENQVRVIEWGDGPAVLSAVIDISQRKRAEQALARERDRLQGYLDIAGVILVALGPDLRVRLINRMGLELLERREEQVVGHDWCDVAMPEGTREAARERLRRVLRGEARLAPTLESAVVTASGEIRDITWSNRLIRGESGAAETMLSSGTDVTERRRMEARAETGRRLLRTALDSIPHGIVVKDADGRYVAVNRAFCEWVDAAPQALIGKLPSDIPGRDPREVEQTMREDREMIRERTAQSSAERILTGPDGRPRNVQHTKALYFDTDEQVAGLVDVSIDITDHKRAERELNDHRHRLADLVAVRTRELEAAQQVLLRNERLAAIGRLTATVGHELRNPLGTISASFAVLSRQPLAKEPGVAHVMERIDRNIARCNRIIEELLAYTRFRELDRRLVRVDEWMAAVIDDLETPEGTTIRLDPGSGVQAELDPERLRQVIVNLVQNAWQAGAGGAVEVAISTRAAPGRLEIRVADSGPGIAPEVREKAFEPLFSTRTFGIGLGLPLVKQIVEQHGGSAAIESTPDQGTVVILTFPLEEEM